MSSHTPLLFLKNISHRVHLQLIFKTKIGKSNLSKSTKIKQKLIKINSHLVTCGIEFIKANLISLICELLNLMI